MRNTDAIHIEEIPEVVYDPTCAKRGALNPLPPSGVAAVAQGRRSGLWQGAARPPKAQVHAILHRATTPGQRRQARRCCPHAGTAHGNPWA